LLASLGMNEWRRSSDAEKFRLLTVYEVARQFEFTPLRQLWTRLACRVIADAIWDSVGVIYPACLSGLR
jgi:hypothetical protein